MISSNHVRRCPAQVLMEMAMFRTARTILCLSALLLGFQKASAFSLLGPVNEAYQQGGSPNQLDYNFPGDIGAPKNLGEEYRWNIPFIYYSFDQNFFDYFGSNGVWSVEQAFAIMNALTNVSSYSADLSEFPQESLRVNFKAQSLGLIDLKSSTLNLLVEQMGLAEPDRYTWTLHDRFLPPGAACPAFIYTVIKRNFDPVTWEPSSYVNGTLYSYNILEFCPTPDRADAVEFQVDPTSNPFSAVASLGFGVGFSDFIETDAGVIRYGFFNTGLTRDDVGGLRYLLRTNNMNWENVTSDTSEFVTNQNPQLLTTTSLALLEAQALTNGPAALQALFPNLVITSFTNTFTVLSVTNFTPFFTNEPWLPAGLFEIRFATNIVRTPVTLFSYTFANLVTFQFVNGNWVAVPVTSIATVTNHTLVQIQTTVSTNAPWSTGTTNFVTQTFVQNFATNTVSGEFFILPANICAITVLSPLLTNVVSFTNVLGTATNINGEFIIQSSVDFFTNHTFVVQTVNCNATTTNLLQGIEKITFIRREFDSLLGRFFNPVTNTYTLTEVTNSTAIRRTFQRVVVRPDILLTAQDLAAGPAAPNAVPFAARGITFNQQNILTGLAGPGTIEPPVFFTYDKVGPALINIGPNFIDEATSFTTFQWASFDGSTNEPVIYPSGRSIRDLENQVLFRIITTTLPDGTAGVAYSQGLAAAGGQPPYTWTLAPGSAPLPSGLTISSAGVVQGTPDTPGTYTFIVRMTDAGARTVDSPVTVIIGP
jgi:hypothetical protein